MTDPDRCKCRTLHLARAQDLDPAARLLHLLPGVSATPLPACRRLVVSYTLPATHLSQLLDTLRHAGIALDASAWSHWRLVVQQYAESVQLHNLAESPRPDRRSEAFSTLYQHHQHGDHDDTPEEWRLYR